MSTPISVSDAGTFTDTLLNGKFVALTDSGAFRDRLVNGSGDYLAQVLADGPTAWWRMDETSGTVLADATGSHPLDIIGTPTFGVAPITSKLPGTAIHWPGSTYAVDSGSTTWLDPVMAGSFSIEFLMRTTNQNCTIVHHGVGQGGSTQSFTIVNSGNTLQIFWTDAANSSHSQNWGGPFPFVTDNIWHHYVATFSASTFTMTLYVDGKPTSVSTPGTAVVKTNTGTPFTVGAIWAPLYGSFYTGDLDEVAIYPIALGADRVLAHYYAAVNFPVELWNTSASYSAGTITTSFAGHVPVAGNLLTARAMIDSNSGTTPTTTTPGGWSLDASVVSSGTPTLTCAIFSTTATGSDTPPVFTPSDTVEGEVILSEWGNTTSFITDQSGSNNAYPGSFSLFETTPFAAFASDLVVGFLAVHRSTTGSSLANGNAYADAGYLGSSNAVQTPLDAQSYAGIRDTMFASHYVPATTGQLGLLYRNTDGNVIQGSVLAVTYGVNIIRALADSATFDDEFILSTFYIALEEDGTFDDPLIAYIPSGPVVPLGMVDIDGRTDVSARFAIDGIPYLGLDFIEGRSDVELSYIGPIFTRLDPIDGSTDIHLGIRATIFAYPDAIDGATDFELFLIPSDPGGGGQPLGEAGAQLNTPIGIAVALSGAIAVIPPAAI